MYLKMCLDVYTRLVNHTWKCVLMFIQEREHSKWKLVRFCGLGIVTWGLKIVRKDCMIQLSLWLKLTWLLSSKWHPGIAPVSRTIWPTAAANAALLTKWSMIRTRTCKRKKTLREGTIMISQKWKKGGRKRGEFSDTRCCKGSSQLPISSWVSDRN